MSLAAGTVRGVPTRRSADWCVGTGRHVVDPPCCGVRYPGRLLSSLFGLPRSDRPMVSAFGQETVER